MDFDEAIAIHSKWKRKLREYLAKHDGSLRPADVAVDHKCTLGQWIYGEGASYFSVPEYTKLKYEHAHIHSLASELVRKANSGEPVGEDT